MSPTRVKPLSTLGHLSQMFPPSPAFDPLFDIPRLPGIEAIITGGTSGIGLETARTLLSKGASVCLMARSEEKGLRVVQELEAMGHEGWGRVSFVQLDLADLLSVGRAVEAYCASHDRLHLLINNAAVMLPTNAAALARSAQGHDLQFATNVLGHYQLTMALLPILLHTLYLLPISPSPASSTDSLPSLSRTEESEVTASFELGPADRMSISREAAELQAATRIGVRVITLSSNVHHFAPASTLAWWSINPAFSAENQDTVRRRLGGMGLYSQSKMGNVLVSNYLSHTLGHTGLVFLCVHPGGIKTALTRGAPRWQNALTNWILYSPAHGALTTLWAATCMDGRMLNGKYCIPWARVGSARPDAEDAGIQRKLIALLDGMRQGG